METLPELLAHALDRVTIDDEHLSHVIRQHLAGVTDVDSRLCVSEWERVTAVTEHGARITGRIHGVWHSVILSDTFSYTVTDSPLGCLRGLCTSFVIAATDFNTFNCGCTENRPSTDLIIHLRSLSVCGSALIWLTSHLACVLLRAHGSGILDLVRFGQSIYSIWINLSHSKQAGLEQSFHFLTCGTNSLNQLSPTIFIVLENWFWPYLFLNLC